jgi:NAD-dependent deacetylase
MINSAIIQNLYETITSANRIVVFTGAGISAESGIPTYRGDNGVWQTYEPARYAHITYFQKDPTYYWRFFRDVRYPVIQQAHPNRGHFIIAELEKRGKLSAVITQNIDGLHREAGSLRVLELHGNTRHIYCTDCKKRYEMTPVFNMLETCIPPKCNICGGFLRPDVVFFGEALPAGVLDEAVKEANSCDLFLVVGSSLEVHPAASLPMVAKQSGAKLVIINKEITPLDGLADLVVHTAFSKVLDAF